MSDQAHQHERPVVHDQVSPQERTDPYGAQVTGIIDKLGKPKPELLWVLLLVIVIEGVQVFEYQHRTDAIREWQIGVNAYIATVEANRRDENRRLQETTRLLAQTLTRQADRLGRVNQAEVAGDKQ